MDGDQEVNMGLLLLNQLGSSNADDLVLKGDHVSQCGSTAALALLFTAGQEQPWKIEPSGAESRKT